MEQWQRAIFLSLFLKKIKRHRGKKCSNCGSLLEEDAAFCTSCGTPVPKENTVVEPNVEEEKVEEISEDKECQTKEEEQKKTCIKCGTEIEEGDAFCLNCGEPVE